MIKTWKNGNKNGNKIRKLSEDDVAIVGVVGGRWLVFGGVPFAALVGAPEGIPRRFTAGDGRAVLGFGHTALALSGRRQTQIEEVWSHAETSFLRSRSS